MYENIQIAESKYGDQKKKNPSHRYTQMRHNINFFISFQEIKSIFLFTKSMWGHGPKSNLEIPDENHIKGLWQEVKTEIYNLDHLAIDYCQFDSAQYPLSAMKLNP